MAASYSHVALASRLNASRHGFDGVIKLVDTNNKLQEALNAHARPARFDATTALGRHAESLYMSADAVERIATQAPPMSEDISSRLPPRLATPMRATLTARAGAFAAIEAGEAKHFAMLDALMSGASVQSQPAAKRSWWPFGR